SPLRPRAARPPGSAPGSGSSGPPDPARAARPRRRPWHEERPGRPPSRRRPSRSRARAASGRSGRRSRHGWRRALSRTVPRGTYSPREMGLADQLTVARIVAAPFVVGLYVWNFHAHAYWATGLFIAAMATDQIDGWLARRQGRTSALGSLLDPVADKVLVLATMIVLVDGGIFAGWMVAAIVARELLISGLRLAAVERGVVIAARDLGKLKTW